MIALRKIALALLALGVSRETQAQTVDLAGAWRGKVTFTTGMFVDLKDLEYMYVFHAGGTMTE